ncbi:head-tail adaptor protein [Dyadobacter sp. CY261]|uniref:head-tail adaptor protein n=1 Tax=Dyadobacter sp. CY261 TaxID=2907203 RepID=UPI001F1DAE3C|nr:head-tail adaptor protein [Dyadobacter sp. CY261]MCF0074033.1 head-tail adaptor protein [Dyadobacter sp. CY261]
MNPGKLRDLLVFYGLTRTRTGRGSSNGNYEFAFELMASVVPGKTITSVENEKLTVVQLYDVKIRYEEGMVPAADMQVVFEGEKYLIKNIKQVDTRNRVVLFMMTKVKQG